MSESIIIKQKNKQNRHLYAIAISLIAIAFFYFDEDSEIYWCYGFVVLIFFNTYNYFNERKPYLEINQDNIRLSGFISKVFNYSNTSQVKTIDNQVILTDTENNSFKINTDKIDASSLDDFKAFISTLEEKLKSNV